MRKKLFSYSLFICLAALSNFSYGQKLDAATQDTLSKIEKKLCKTADSMRLMPIPDDRVQYHYELIKGLKSALAIPNAYLYSFDSLKERIHIIDAPDKSFKLFNWLVANSEWARTYSGVIQTAKNPTQLIPLIDYSAKLDDISSNSVLSNKNWYGAEYYNILQDTLNGKRIYLLFGYNTNSTNINRKLIDVLSFNTDYTEANFGAPIFNGENQFGKVGTYNRYILHFKKGVTTVLNYDKDKNMIVLDKLESDIGAPSRYDSYVPSGRMDGFRKNNGRYQYQKNIVNILKLGDGNAPINGVMKP